MMNFHRFLKTCDRGQKQLESIDEFHKENSSINIE